MVLVVVCCGCAQARKLRGEVDILSTSNQALHKERQKDQMLLDSLNADVRQLRVEENAWKRIEKSRLLGQLDTAQSENTTLRSQLEHLEHRMKDSGNSEQRIRQLEDALQQKEMQLIRGNADKNSKAGVIAQQLATVEMKLQDARRENEGLKEEMQSLRARTAGNTEAQQEAHRPVPVQADPDKMTALATRCSELERTLQNKVSAWLRHAPASGFPMGDQMRRRQSWLRKTMIAAESRHGFSWQERERAQAVAESESWRNALSASKSSGAPASSPNILSGWFS